MTTHVLFLVGLTATQIPATTPINVLGTDLLVDALILDVVRPLMFQEIVPYLVNRRIGRGLEFPDLGLGADQNVGRDLGSQMSVARVQDLARSLLLVPVVGLVAVLIVTDQLEIVQSEAVVNLLKNLVRNRDRGLIARKAVLIHRLVQDQILHSGTDPLMASYLF